MKFRPFLKVLKYFLLSFLGLIVLILAVLFARPVWRNLVTYPAFQKEVEAFQGRKKDCPIVSDQKIFKGVLHLHSYWSHDSKGTITELISAAKKNGINFIFLTDHPHGNQDSFPRGYKGMYDGVLVEPGSEKQDFVSWPMKDSTVINWKINKDTVLKSIVEGGGMLFYSHTEIPHNWANPFFQGMEIYNFHTNVLEKKMLPIATNFIINGSKYRQWAYREIFDRQTAILANWDTLNIHRKIIGFSAVDVHENVNIRARYLKDGRVQWFGFNAKPIDTVKVTFRNRWLFHEPDASGWIFRWMLVDTYDCSFNYVVNYLFADTLTTKNISHHLIEGHHFTAFNSLANASGFCYYGEGADGRMKGMMGDSIRLADLKFIKAVSPYPARFILIKDGKTVETTSSESYSYTFEQPLSKGAYRLEAEVKPGKDWLPWIYTNPIYVY